MLWPGVVSDPAPLQAREAGGAREPDGGTLPPRGLLESQAEGREHLQCPWGQTPPTSESRGSPCPRGSVSGALGPRPTQLELEGWVLWGVCGKGVRDGPRLCLGADGAAALMLGDPDHPGRRRWSLLAPTPSPGPSPGPVPQAVGEFSKRLCARSQARSRGPRGGLVATRTGGGTRKGDEEAPVRHGGPSAHATSTQRRPETRTAAPSPARVPRPVGDTGF